MVSFNEWMQVGLEACAPSGEGTAAERRRVFRDLVDGWNEEEDVLRGMTKREVRQQIECP